MGLDKIAVLNLFDNALYPPGVTEKNDTERNSHIVTCCDLHAACSPLEKELCMFVAILNKNVGFPEVAAYTCPPTSGGLTVWDD